MKTFSRLSILFAFALTTLSALAGTAPHAKKAGKAVHASRNALAGVWRVYSARLYYDAGGGGAEDAASTRTLKLLPDGTWRCGSSHGTYTIAPIQAADWKRWGVDSYGPTRKIILSHWDKGTADGPLEGSGRVDFAWVIYHVKPPIVSAPGTVFLKYGRQTP